MGSREPSARRLRRAWVLCHDRIEPSDCPDSSEACDWYEPADTIDIAEAKDPKEPNDATDPIDRTDPTDPIESTESAEAMDRTDRRERMERSDRTGPSSPTSREHSTRYPDLVELPSLRAVIGGALVLIIAAGFEFEHSMVFLGGLVLFLAWCGYVLFAPDES